MLSTRVNYVNCLNMLLPNFVNKTSFNYLNSEDRSPPRAVLDTPPRHALDLYVFGLWGKPKHLFDANTCKLHTERPLGSDGTQTVALLQQCYPLSHLNRD